MIVTAAADDLIGIAPFLEQWPRPSAARPGWYAVIAEQRKT